MASLPSAPRRDTPPPTPQLHLQKQGVRGTREKSSGIRGSRFPFLLCVILKTKSREVLGGERLSPVSARSLLTTGQRLRQHRMSICGATFHGVCFRIRITVPQVQNPISKSKRDLGTPSGEPHRCSLLHPRLVPSWRCSRDPHLLSLPRLVIKMALCISYIISSKTEAEFFSSFYLFTSNRFRHINNSIELICTSSE